MIIAKHDGFSQRGRAVSQRLMRRMFEPAKGGRVCAESDAETVENRGMRSVIKKTSTLSLSNILHVFTIILALLVTAPAAHAITTESLDKAVDNIQSAYQAVSDLAADFQQKTYVAILEKNITNAGTFRWKNPGRFFIDYTGDQPKQYISNNEKMWIYVPGDTQAEVYKIDNKTISKEALEFMRGFGNIKKHYKIIEWKKRGARTDLTLVPLFPGAPYSKLKCQFRGDNLLDEVTIHNITGNISTYKFSNIRINTGLPDDLFIFKKPKGVKIVTVQ